MAVNAQLQEKLDLFKSCVRFEKPARIPNVSSVFTWMFLDSPYPLSKALSDPALIEEVVFAFHERYQFDAYIDLGTRNHMGVLNALGDQCAYKIDDESGAINFQEKILMQDSEYDEYIHNKDAMMWKMFLRKFPGLKKGQAVKALGAFLEFGQFAGKIINKFVATYDTPALFNMFSVPMIPYENFVGYYRGMRDGALDLRKHKSELKEALDRDFEAEVLPKLLNGLNQPNETFCFDAYTAILAHSVMSNRQFGELYWPYLKRIIDEVVARDKTLYIYCESSILRLAEFFQDIPKGHVALHLEQDDNFEVRKKLPNICLSGGMKTQLLGHATPEACADYARKLLDEMGEGYIFSQDRMVSFRTDCTRENLLAVNEVVRNYRP